MSGATLEEVLLDGDTLYWIERRPLEGGRNAIVRRAPDGTLSEALPMPYNARTRVHEYGGGNYTVSDGVIYFSNFADQRLYRLASGGVPKAVMRGVSLRYADGVVDHQRHRLIWVG